MFAATHALALGLVARGARRRAADRPSRRARRPGRLPRAAARRRRRPRLGGEDPRPRRAAARLAGRGHGRLRVPQRRRRAVRRPRRRGARSPRCGRSWPATRARSGSGRPRPSSSRRARRSRPTSTGCGATGPASRGWRRRSPRCPVYRTYIRDLPAREDLRGAARGGARRSGSRRRRTPFVTRFQQTTPPIMAKGVEDTAFYRYAAAARAQRRRRRPEPLRDRRRDVPRRQRRARRALPAQPALHPDARHEALGRRARAARRAGGAGGRVGRGRARAGASCARRCATDGAPDPVEEYTIFQTLAGAWPLEPERLCGVHGEGDARGQARRRAGSSRTRRTSSGVLGLLPRALRPRAVPRGVRAVRRAASRSSASCTRCARPRSS